MSTPMTSAAKPDERSGSGRALTVVVTVATIVVLTALGSMLVRGRPIDVIFARWMVHNGPLSVVALWLGWLIMRRLPGHRIGLIFLGVGLSMAAHVAIMAVTDARLVAEGFGTHPDVRFVPNLLPRDIAVTFFLTTWVWVLAVGIASTLLLLLFPDGRLPGREWWPATALSVIGTGLVAAGYMVWSWPTSTRLVPMTEQPSEVGVATTLLSAGWLVLLASVVLAIVSLGVRWRAADAAQRSQLRPVIIAGSVFALALVGLFPVQQIWVPMALVALAGFFTTYVVAILRFRLHDLDVVINRAVAASVLAALVMAIYLGVVVGVGSMVGRRADHPLLPLIAAGLVAVLFEPARRRVRRIVDRVLYGRDADAFELLSELSGQLRDASSLDSVTATVASLLVRGTGASGAAILRFTPDGPRTQAEVGACPQPPLLRVPIVHEGEPLGEVTLHGRGDADLAPDAAELAHNIAATLGAVLRNAQLTGELEDQVDELRRSRQRIVTAQDAARRELERDLHDGAQARLVALRLQVGMLGAKLEALPGAAALTEVRAGLGHLGAEVDGTIRMLRDLSRGLHPPVLRSDGIAAALRAACRGLPVHVEVAAPRLGRYSPEVEAAVYFSCLEAVKNAATHAVAHRVVVELDASEDELCFTVRDDGRGFDVQAGNRGRGLTNLRDRIDAHDGILHVESTLGSGTVVRGRIPQPAPAC